MKIILTGSNGFIGTNLKERLLKDGHIVHSFDTKMHKSMFQAWPKADIIYHLACINQMAAVSDPFGNLEVNAYGAKYAADQAADMGIPLVYTSTASVYGRSHKIPTPVDADIEPLTDYAVAKYAGELFIQKSGCDYQIYRLSNVYGPHQTLDNPYCGVIGRFITQALDGKPLTVIEPGTQTRDYTYIDDVVNILKEPDINNQVKNISRSYEVSPLELVAMLSEVLGKRLEIKYIPARPIDSIKSRRLITNHRCPTTLYDGLSATVEWFYEFRGEKSSGRIKQS